MNDDTFPSSDGARRFASSGTMPAAARRITRRDALRTLAVGGSIAMLPPVLAACGSSGSASTTTSSTGTSQPKRGGSLDVGILGVSSSDTLDANNAISFADNARVGNLYDGLGTFNRDMGIELDLAEEISPTSSAATEWLIRLKPDIEFHNGKPLTSADVAYTLQRVSKLNLNGESILSVADTANIKLLDSKSLTVPMHLPVSVFDEFLCTPNLFMIVPVGYDVHRPVGTGPFKYKSFTPGQQSVFTRNANYWEQGLPYLDELVLIDVASNIAQSDGIESGQFDAIDQVPFTAIDGLHTAGLKTTISKGYSWNPITMRVDSPPFNDVRVRQALRLICDRPQMLELAIGGTGDLGNDLFAPFDPSYDHSLLQRQQDIGQAKSLLKAAGHPDLTVTLQTSSQIGVGVLETAQIFKQQATQAGVTVNVQNLSESDFYGPNYTKWVFAQDDWSTASYLVQVWWSMLPTSDYNECHFDNPAYNALANKALATVDLASRTEIVHEMQTIEWNEGGYIIPFFTGFVDCVRANVQGMAPAKVGLPFNDYRFKYLWLS